MCRKKTGGMRENLMKSERMRHTQEQKSIEETNRSRPFSSSSLPPPPLNFSLRSSSKGEVKPPTHWHHPLSSSPAPKKKRRERVIRGPGMYLYGPICVCVRWRNKSKFLISLSYTHTERERREGESCNVIGRPFFFLHLINSY